MRKETAMKELGKVEDQAVSPEVNRYALPRPSRSISRTDCLSTPQTFSQRPETATKTSAVRFRLNEVQISGTD
jgi:hypothetical protein